MKRDQIRAEMDAHLQRIGFRRKHWEWQPQSAQLLLMVGDGFRTFKLPSGMSRRALSYEMGRIAGLAEAAGIEPAPARKAIGRADHTNTELPAAAPAQ